MEIRSTKRMPEPSPPSLSQYAPEIVAALERWSLTPDGPLLSTPSSHLLPVLFQERKAMLKLALCAQEAKGAALLQWWSGQGQGAAPVYALEGNALLMARATGSRSLTHLALNGQDDEATAIACGAIARLHDAKPPASGSPGALVLTPLAEWFSDLAKAAHDFETEGKGLYARCWEAASVLLASPRQPIALHGDFHHANILHAGDGDGNEDEWWAIDPKGLLGERGFDYANLFCNPDIAFESRVASSPVGLQGLPIAAVPERFAARLALVSRCSGIEEERLLLWIAAWGGLSAAWFIQDGQAPGVSLVVAQQALSLLGK